MYANFCNNHPNGCVPGHEEVGRIEALGGGVSRWKIGQRVGFGLYAGEDGVCEPCRRGDAVNYQNPVVSGVTADGGYAEVMIAEARGIASIPEELTSTEAAPLLCAGMRIRDPHPRTQQSATHDRQLIAEKIYYDQAGALEQMRGRQESEAVA